MNVGVMHPHSRRVDIFKFLCVHYGRHQAQ
jgi:hypothetical protein